MSFKKKQILVVGLAVAGMSATFAACGGSDGTTDGDGKGNSGGAASTGTGFINGAGGGLFGSGGSSSPQGSGGDANTCAGEKSTAELVPLDLYIMLDSSGSMEDITTGRVTKWDAVTEALTTFFTDPQSVGLGVGLQYFPLRNPSVPDSCRSNAECGTGGPCALKICENLPGITACNTTADCGAGGGRCIAVGACSLSGAICAPVNSVCAGFDGFCDASTRSVCVAPDYCDADAYAAPDVEIAQLSAGTASALVASISAKQPEGSTPTSGALAGAIKQASTYASAHPDHKVVAVLATDGLPTECTPVTTDGIAQIASAGLAASPSVSTFVIGVFGRNDTSGETAMNAIAEAGGTSEAFIVDANADVSQAFLDALNAIRGQSLACEYLVPLPTDGQVIDFGKVNVEHTPPGSSAATTILYVANEQGCDPTTGGWYYDIDPATGGTPTKIEMCSSTCTLLKGDGGEVNISVGCQTEVGIPR